MLKKAAMALIIGASLSACANLDERGNAVLGGAIGGATGAAVGHEVGGRDGAIVGAGVGAAAGAAIGQRNTHSDRHVVVEGSGHHPVAHSGVRVPPGHMPPPGKCRVWFPDRPPGHQPPPGHCGELRHHVPQGAVLVGG